MKSKSSICVPQVTEPARPLGEAGGDLWERVIGEYAISDAGGLELLLLACEALDRVAELRSAVQTDGIVVRSATGMVRVHPAVKAEAVSMAFVGRTIARLGLDVEPIGRVGRPSVPTSVGWR